MGGLKSFGVGVLVGALLAVLGAIAYNTARRPAPAPLVVQEGSGADYRAVLREVETLRATVEGQNGMLRQAWATIRGWRAPEPVLVVEYDTVVTTDTLTLIQRVGMEDGRLTTVVLTPSGDTVHVPSLRAYDVARCSRRWEWVGGALVCQATPWGVLRASAMGGASYDYEAGEWRPAMPLTLEWDAGVPQDWMIRLGADPFADRAYLVAGYSWGQP